MNILGEEHDLITLDWETYYGTGYSLSLQAYNTFKYVADEQFLIHGVGVKINGEKTGYYNFHDDVERNNFQLFLDSYRSGNRKRKVALLGHNMKFDGFILHYHFDWHPDFYLDTMGMSKGMFANASSIRLSPKKVLKPHSLGALAIRLWPENEDLRKGDELEETRNLRELPDNVAENLKRYCIKDVDLTYEAFLKMEPHFPDEELALNDWTLRCMCEPWFEVDTQLVDDEIDHQVELTKAAIARAKSEHGISLSTLKSDKQFAAWLEAKGVKIELKRNTADTDDIPALGKKDAGFQKMQASHPELESVWEARINSKSNIQESRARWFKYVASVNDGKMPIALNYYGAEQTGRWSGGEKLNQQNLPQNRNGDIVTDPNSGRLRRCMLAPDGCVVIVRDLSNIEGRMLAWEADAEWKLDLFRNDGCPYLFMAENICDAPIGSFTKAANGDERNLGKVAELGLGYGMGHSKFWIGVNTGSNPADLKLAMPIEQARHIVGVYRSTNIEINRYWTACENMLPYMASLDPGATMEFGPLTIMRNMAILPNGMALQYPGLSGTPNKFDGYDFSFGNDIKLYGARFAQNITQALARLVIAEQALKIQKELDSNYGRNVARLVHMVHDENITIGPEKYADEIYDMKGEVMSTPPIWAPNLPLKSEGGYAREYSK